MLIAAAGLGFVVNELIRQWDEVAAATRGAFVTLLLVAFVVGVGSMTTIGLLWRECLSTLGSNLGSAVAMKSYFVGQLGKYIPGGIWPVVGRAEMASRSGVPRTIAYASTVLSMGLTYLAAGLTAVVALVAGGEGLFAASTWYVWLLLLAGVVMLHPAPAARVLTLASKVSRRELELEPPSWGRSIILLMLHLPVWLGIGTATWLVASGLNATGAEYGNLLGATALSWLTGFVAVGVPGGIGVREAVFVAAATSLGGGVAAAVAIVARVLFILVDAAGAAAASAIASSAQRRPLRH